jgi:hypothetical protein
VRLWPRSLAGQLALVSAVALFVGQAINFGLILRERATSRLAQASRPVATRVADLLEREAAGVAPRAAVSGGCRSIRSRRQAWSAARRWRTNCAGSWPNWA